MTTLTALVLALAAIAIVCAVARLLPSGSDVSTKGNTQVVIDTDPRHVI